MFAVISSSDFPIPDFESVIYLLIPASPFTPNKEVPLLEPPVKINTPANDGTQVTSNKIIITVTLTIALISSELSFISIHIFHLNIPLLAFPQVAPLAYKAKVS